MLPPILILAGGFGTRLQGVLDGLPKALAPIEGKSFLFHLIQSLYKQGGRHFIMSLYHQADQIKETIANETWPNDLRFDFVVETSPMGTGGAIKYAYENLGLIGPIVVCNGDTYFSNGLESFIDAAKNSPALAIVKVPEVSRFGSVLLDSRGYIQSFEEKGAKSGAGFINMGTYYFNATFISQMPNGAHSIEKDVFEKLAEKNKLRAVEIETDFIDIGVPEDYEKFKNRMLTKAK